MLKQNKKKIILTTLITLLPMFAGCVLWNRLPDTIATHFGSDNVANGWSSKPFTVFGIPAILAVLHLFCLAGTAADPKWHNIGKKPLGFVFWIIPFVSIDTGISIYAFALGVPVDIGFSVCLLIGLVFIVLGNILPKAKQNYTFGFKLPWTLHDPENWNRTNRLAGWCMVIAGIVMCVTAYWHNAWIVFGVLLLVFFVPVVYSYLYYRRHDKNV